MLNGSQIDAAINRAVRSALREHKHAGNPISVLRNGKVVWVPAKEIEVE
jgi:hypothetical protein